MPPRRVALDALNPNQLDSVGGGRGQKAAGSKWLWAFSQQVIKERTHIIAAPARVVDLMITSLKQPQCLLGSFFPKKIISFAAGKRGRKEHKITVFENCGKSFSLCSSANSISNQFSPTESV